MEITSFSLKMQAVIFFDKVISFTLPIISLTEFLCAQTRIALFNFRRWPFKNPAIWQCKFGRENDGLFKPFINNTKDHLKITYIIFFNGD